MAKSEFSEVWASTRPASGTETPGYAERNRTVSPEATGSGDGSVGSPWTLKQGLAQAVPGDVVGVMAGIYVGQEPATDPENFPGFEISVSGTESQPITFVAQYRAALDEGPYSEVRSGGQASAPSEFKGGWPALGSPYNSTTRWVNLVGFYFNEGNPDSAISEDCGIVHIEETFDMNISYCKFIGYYGRSGNQGAGGNNYSGIRIENCERINVLDCHFEDWVGGGPVNSTGVTIYNSLDVWVQHCYFKRCGHAFHYKGDKESRTRRLNGGGMRYCRTERCPWLLKNHAPAVAIAEPRERVTVSHNLCLDVVFLNESNGITQDGGGSGSYGWDIFNNTLIGYADPAYNGGSVLFARKASNKDWKMYNNIFYTLDNYLCDNWQYGDDVAAMASFFEYLDYNCVYGNRESFIGNGSSFKALTMSSWRSQSGHDTHSIESDPQFVDAASGNYRLSAGSPAANGRSGIPMGCYVTGDEVIGVRP